MWNSQTIFKLLLLVVALMTGAFSLVREVLQFVDPVKYPEKSLFFACLRIACILAFAILWWQESRARAKAERELNASKPQFALGLGDIVWLYRDDRDLTVFFILANIINSGQPSVALNWKGRYRLGNSVEDMQIFTIHGTYDVTVGHDRISLTNDNLLNVKALEIPIGKGQFLGGRLLLTVKGDRTAQVKALQHRIEVECTDYLGNKSTAVYIPDPRPSETLSIHYSEKVERVVDESISDTALPPPEEE